MASRKRSVCPADVRAWRWPLGLCASGPDLWGGGWGPWPSTEGEGRPGWSRELAPTFVGTCSPLVCPSRQRPGRPLQSPSASPGSGLWVPRGARDGAPAGNPRCCWGAAWTRGLTGRSGLFFKWSHQLMPPSLPNPHESGACFSPSGGPGVGRRTGGGRPGCQPLGAPGTAEGGFWEEAVPFLGVGQHLFPGELWGWPGAARPAARALCHLREPGCQLRGTN